jgi:hypothetical protein
MYPAEKNETGAFISKKGAKALSIIRVSCSYADLRLLQYKWSFLEQDYMPKKYNMETMKSDYTRNIDEHETYSQQTQPYEPVPEEPVQQQPSTTTRQPQEDKTEIVEFACVAKGQVTTHANGMRHVQIYDPIKRSVFGKLYIRDEDYGDIRDGQQMRIRAQKKNNDYLFVANV